MGETLPPAAWEGTTDASVEQRAVSMEPVPPRFSTAIAKESSSIGRGESVTLAVDETRLIAQRAVLPAPTLEDKWNRCIVKSLKPPRLTRPAGRSSFQPGSRCHVLDSIFASTHPHAFHAVEDAIADTLEAPSQHWSAGADLGQGKRCSPGRFLFRNSNLPLVLNHPFIILMP